MNPIHVYPKTSSLASSELRETRNKQQVIEAKITLARQSISDLYAESQQLEDALWMQIDAECLVGILEAGRYGKSLDVRPSLGVEGRAENARLAINGDLLVGDYTRNDRFRKGQYFVRRDFGQITSTTA